VANRGRLELESLIGFFVNTLVLRLDLSDQPTFLQALARLKQVALDAYAHQEVPFEKVVEALEPQRDMSRSPLFQILFVHQSSALPLTALADLSLRLHNIESTTATFDITLMVAESEQGLLSIIEYNTDLFERETIERLLEHWQLLLESIVANPEQPVQYLQLLTPAEQHQLNQWNPSFLPYPSHPCFPTLFAEQVQRAPHAIAIFSEGQTLSYLELHQQSNQLAHYLQRHGIGLEFHVGVCMERTPQLIVTILGILKAGAAYVPVDPNLPEERFFFLLKDAQVPLLLTQQSLRERIPAFPGPCIYLDDEHPIIAQESMDNLDIDLDLANLAYIVYTSGSTGTPKGVLLTHRGLYNLVEVQKHFLGIQASDKVLQFSSISFDSLIWEIVMALGTGASLCIGGTYDVLPGQELLHLLRRQAITIMTVPPSALAVLPAQDLPDLHTILSVGEACPVALANTWSQGRRFIDGYGPTEMTVCATLGDFSVGQEKLTIGKPISHTQVYLLDRFYQPVPVGAVGEIFLSGDGLARGYLHQPDVTAERFIPHPFSHQPGARLYQTGDMGRYRPDGTLEFLGRIDQQVKLRGFRIELAEIETALLQHPAIHQSIVLMHEHADRGKYLVAYLVAKDKELSQETIRHYLQRRLPVYMIPASFVFLDTLPLNQSGKIDRQSLQHLHATQTQEQSAVAAPRNEVEELLVDLWSEVLGLPQIGIHDNFFSSGGHSLLASQLIARIRATMRIDVPLMHLFTSPTISEFAAVLPQYETTSGQIAAIARTRKRLKGLTPEEMQALLDEKKRGNRG
jgi:amino acid adenylation domain-containing protein